MRLSEKLILFVLSAALVPLTLVALGLLRQSEAELTERISEQQSAVASAAAEQMNNVLMGAINAVASNALAINWQSATHAEVEGGLKLLLAQSELIAATSIVDLERPATPVVSRGGGDASKLSADFLAAFPFTTLAERGDRGQLAMTAVVFKGPTASVQIAVQVSAASADPSFVVALLDLAPLTAVLKARATSSTGSLQLVDSEARIIAASEGSSGVPLSPTRLSMWLKGDGVGRTEDHERVAIAQVPGKFGMSVVIAIDDAVAMKPVYSLRRTILLGSLATLAVLTAVAVVFTRRLTARLAKLGKAVDAYGKGLLETRIDVGGADELAELGDTFNQMGDELEKARLRLTRWNDDLQKRVEEATAELKAAQAQLLEAQKLAAIGSLGAGVAHEINNPLCGILGNAQLLMLDRSPSDADFDLLKKIEESAKRCRDITQNLLRFSQSQGDHAPRPTDLNAIVRSTLEYERQRFLEAKIEVKASYAPGPLHVFSDPEKLAQVLQALLSNARTALMKSTVKRVFVNTRQTASGVELEVEDTGKGISAQNLTRIFDPFFTTKDVWSNIGLGLSIAYRIIQEHQGRIEVESELGKGAKFTVRLPTAEKSSEQSLTRKAEENLDVGGQGVGLVR